MEATTYNTEGKAIGSIALPERIFGLPWNADLVHQVVVSMQSNARTPIAHTKGRGDVRGGGRKPWQQKGTGRARHGSRRSPIWRGGGITHGPTNEKDYSKKINKKMRVKALYVVLSRKYKDNEIIFVDSLSFAIPKSAQAKALLVALSAAGFGALMRKKHNAAIVALGTRDSNVVKSFRNIGHISIDEVRNLNPVDVLNHKYVILVDPKVSVEALDARLGEQKEIKKAPVVKRTTVAVKKKPVQRKAAAK